VQICPKCGEENPDRFRVCGLCATKLAPETPLEQVRKTITVVFSDLKGSTTLGESFDPEPLREALTIYFNEMRGVLESHGGRVEKYIGDAIVGVFGLPTAHEDDALRAVRAAAEMRTTLAIVNERIEPILGSRLENRTGIHTGEVVAGDVSTGQYITTGDAMNTAARLEAAAPTGEILIGEPTYRLVKHAVEVEAGGPLTLKGKAAPVQAFRLISVTEGDSIRRHLGTPMVGRERELTVLTEALDRAATHRRAELVTVIGPAGAGKSRLLHELLSHAGVNVLSVRGRCLSYGDGITFFPLAEMVRDAAGVAPDDPLEDARSKLIRLLGPEHQNVAQRVGATIGLSAAAFSQEEIFWGTRRFFEILAQRGPVVALVDDIHWAEQTFLDLLVHLVEFVQGVPLLVICSARPEFRDEHGDWLREEENAHAIALESLSDQESSQVVDNFLGEGTLDHDLRARIIEVAQGNPLFVEQLVSMMIDDAILQRDAQGRWALMSDPGALSLPPSISALLTARLDRLGPSERAVIQRGAVIGLVFFRGAVEELVPEGTGGERVGASLASLIRKELIHPHRSEFAGQESYVFAHGLIKDAAYHSLLKRTRAELHQRFVDWADRMAPERVMEYEEILGYHLEQAFLILAQLGRIDEHTRAIGVRGARYLASAGHRAMARGDMPAAASLLHRAAHLLPTEDLARPRWLMEAGEAFMEAGEFLMADGALQSAIEGAAALWDQALETSARLLKVHLDYATKASGSEEELILEVEHAITALEQLGDSQASGHRVRQAGGRQPYGSTRPPVGGRDGDVRPDARRTGHRALRGDPGQGRG
jgi:class 3 adenylate cyclase